MFEVRRCVESGAAVRLAEAVVAPLSKALPVTNLTDTVAQLRELITAIDRRLPQVQRTGEASIANAAVRLRIEAEKRISEIELEIAGRRPRDRRPAAP